MDPPQRKSRARQQEKTAAAAATAATSRARLAPVHQRASASEVASTGAPGWPYQLLVMPTADARWCPSRWQPESKTQLVTHPIEVNDLWAGPLPQHCARLDRAVS